MGTEIVCHFNEGCDFYLQRIFSVLGSREEVICDNGMQFTSKECKEFPIYWGFTLITSSRHYLRGHGFIERQVRPQEAVEQM